MLIPIHVGFVCFKASKATNRAHSSVGNTLGFLCRLTDHAIERFDGMAIKDITSLR